MGTRRIPNWMSETAPKTLAFQNKCEPNDDIKENKLQSSEDASIIHNKPQMEPLKNKDLDTKQPLRRSTRNSSKTEQLTPVKEKPTNYPPVRYNGKIKYYNEMLDIACVCDELTKWVESQETDVVPVGFDMEWPFSFQTGPGKSALIQICCTLDECYLFHLPKLKKLPAALIYLLKHKKVILHGVNIKCDLRKLARDFPEVNVDSMIDQCIDLGTWCNDVCSTGGRWSLERLVIYICKLQIDKNKKVRMSKWDIIPLDENQLMYAAIDAYIAQVIYSELKRREELKQQNEAKVVEIYGQKTLSAIKKLNVNLLEKSCLE